MTATTTLATSSLAPDGKRGFSLTRGGDERTQPGAWQEQKVDDQLVEKTAFGNGTATPAIGKRVERVCNPIGHGHHPSNVFDIAACLRSNSLTYSVLGCVRDHRGELRFGSLTGVRDRQPSSSIERALVHVLERRELCIGHPCLECHSSMRMLTHPARIDLSDGDDDLFTQGPGQSTPHPDGPKRGRAREDGPQVRDELGYRVNAGDTS